MPNSRLHLFTALSLWLLAFIYAPPLSAKLDDRMMCQAYIQEDMTFWGKSLHQESLNEAMTPPEMALFCHYLYGYLAYCCDTKNLEELEYFKPLMAQDLKHLIALPKYRTEALVYMAYFKTMQIKLTPWKAMSLGPQGAQLLEDAQAIDPHNGMVLGCQGDMNFFRPSLFGGDKHQAVKDYTGAIKALRAKHTLYYEWTICYYTLSLIQALEKTDQKSAAHALAQETLQNYPTFKFLLEHPF